MVSTDFTPLEYKLYGRQMILPELGTAGQGRLKKAHALIVGAGALGSPALLYLAGAGVGTITVVDDDEVEVSNLHRQIIHSYAEVGNSKAESAATSMRALNPAVTVRVVKERFTPENAAALLAGVDILLDGSDNFATRYAASAACATAAIPHVWAAILGFDAQLSVFWAGQGPVYEDLYPMPPAEGSVPTCATAGVMGAMAGVVGASMAMEAVKILAGVGRALLGEVAYYSALEGRWEYIPLRGASGKSVAEGGKNVGDHQVKEVSRQNFVPVSDYSPTPQYVTKRNIADEFFDFPHPGHKTKCTYDEYRQLARLEDVVLLDVRERVEYAALALPSAVNLPLSEIEKMAEAATLKGYVSAKFRLGHQVLVLYCTGGPRASLALNYMREAGCKTVYEMVDGLPGWLAQQG